MMIHVLLFPAGKKKGYLYGKYAFSDKKYGVTAHPHQSQIMMKIEEVLVITRYKYDELYVLRLEG